MLTLILEIAAIAASLGIGAAWQARHGETVPVYPEPAAVDYCEGLPTLYGTDC